jgi:hypothetical protein
MPDVTFSKSMPAINGSPDVSFKSTDHVGQSTFKNVAPPVGVYTPHLRNGSVYMTVVKNKNRHESKTPAIGRGLIRETPVIEIIH